MFMNQVPNNAELPAIIINELRDIYGIKYRKDKKSKATQSKEHHKIFKVPLKELDRTDVKLSNGIVCEVPTFVSNACSHITENIEVEGLFRKAGSTARQKEIREQLELGKPLDASVSVIDIANILKYFFRELPDPLLPPGNFQESILRCLLCKGNNERKISAIKMICLLLPTIKLNTLAFFMQFLNLVTMHSSTNKMSAKNLAIIFAPSLMPIHENIGTRLISHVQIVEILIEHADEIGVVPNNLLNRIPRAVTLPEATVSDPLNHTMMSTTSSRLSSEGCQLRVPDTDIKKKKKRRSGSLTRMFNGIRKMVGAIGSAENLDETEDTEVLSTPCINKSKKRKVLESSAFSSKKKKDVLALLPGGGILPSTPMCANKPTKKSRLSLGGKRYTKNPSQQTNQSNGSKPSIVSTLERRWSFIAGNRNQNTEKSTQPTVKDSTLSAADAQATSILPANWETQMSKSEYEEIKERVTAIETRISKEFTKLHSSMLNNSTDSVDTSDNRRNGPERVLEKFEKTLEETEAMNSTPMTEQLARHLSRDLKIRSSTEHKVIRSPSARKIGSIRRRSQENVRLTRNKSWHLGANSTANVIKHIRTSPLQPLPNVNSPNVNKRVQIPRVNLKRGRPNTFQTGLRTKQASPTHKTTTDDRSKQFTVTNQSKEDNQQLQSNDRNMEVQLQNEKWICADVFFDGFTSATPTKHDETMPLNTSKNSVNSATKSKPIRKRLNMNDTSMEVQSSNTPRSISKNIDMNKTPMLPPRLPIVKKTPAKTPHSSLSTNVTIRNHLTPLWMHEQHQQIGGRASIARLRSQNAGMVMAKAKLFNELVVEQPPNVKKAKTSTNIESQATSEPYVSLNPQNQHHQHFVSNSNGRSHENKHESESSLRTKLNNHLLTQKSTDSPRRKTPNPLSVNTKNGSNGVNRRQRLRAHRHTPIKKTPTAMDSSVLAFSDSNNSIQSPMTRRTPTVDSGATPLVQRTTLIDKPPRRLVPNKRK